MEGAAPSFNTRSVTENPPSAAPDRRLAAYPSHHVVNRTGARRGGRRVPGQGDGVGSHGHPGDLSGNGEGGGAERRAVARVTRAVAVEVALGRVVSQGAIV